MQSNAPSARFLEIQRFDGKDMHCCTQELAKRYLANHAEHGVVWLYYADSLYPTARYAEAISALHQAALRCPPTKLHLVYCRFGHLYLQKGNFRSAEQWYRKAVSACPADATYHIFLGALLASAGRLQDAEAVHRRATRCKVGCIDEAFFNLGLVLRAQQRYPEALRCFRRALKIDPKYKKAKTQLIDVQEALRLRRHSPKNTRR